MRNKCKYSIVCNDEKFISLAKEIVSELNPDNEFEMINENTLHTFFSNAINNIIIIENNYIDNQIIDFVKNHSSLRLNNVIYIIESGDNKLPIHFDEIIDLKESRSLLSYKLSFANTLLEYKIKLQSEEAKIKLISNQLQSDLNDMFSLASHFMQARLPGAIERTDRIVEATLWIANQLDASEINMFDIKVAAHFSQAGRINLPDNLLNQVVMEDGLPSDPLLKQIPHVAKEIVSKVKRFQDAANILYHIYENLDGSGMPDGSQSWQIPLESRIIRVVLDYEEELDRGVIPPSEIIAKMVAMGKRIFDHRVVHLLEQYIRSENREDYDPTEKPVLLSQLVPNMVINRDVISINGLKLVSKGTNLTQNSIDFILNHAAYDSVLGNIYVKK